jgi:anaerobic ribonucleoside-triphosphate reductase activating protein
MRYAGIIPNDFAAAPGVCTTFFVQGCPIKCPGCHNPESWDFEGGKEFDTEVLNKLEEDLLANGINRTLCIMGGEPLCQENLFLTTMVVTEMKHRLPNLKIWIWTGYEYKDILKEKSNPKIKYILETVNGLVTGPFIQSLRDITLPMRGSSNQEIIKLKD